ncbi:MAG: hypothetical protein HY875_04480 [Chloroflexi bacterium]|nr:hypothetical protein [Chloroflexota bacterium]
MANAKKRGARFVFTRIATGASAVVLTSALWAGVAATAPQKKWDTAQAETEQPALEVYEQDGWRWDPDRQEWLLMEETAPGEAQVWSGGSGDRPVIVVEQQDVIYYVFQWQPDDKGGGTWVQVPGDGKSQPPKTAATVKTTVPAAGPTTAPTTAGVPAAGGVPTNAPPPTAAPTKPPLPGWVPTSTPVPANTPPPTPIPGGGGGGGGGTPSNPPAPTSAPPPAPTATPKPKPTATPTKSKAS